MLRATSRVVFIGGKPGNFKGKGGGDHLPYFPHWLLPQIPPCYMPEQVPLVVNLHGAEAVVKVVL